MKYSRIWWAESLPVSTSKAFISYYLSDRHRREWDKQTQDFVKEPILDSTN
jgi:hypothetical protein